MGWLPTAVAVWLLMLFSGVVGRGIVTGNFEGLTAMVPVATLAAAFFLGQQAVRIVREVKPPNGNAGGG